ncbi:MAG: acyl carrier protein [Planctomycetes bacterium]|nr:acyl carrier protein [Planctomycetota bacterium]
MNRTAPQEESICQFLIQSTGDESLKPETDLLASGLLDSLTMMDLVVFIEVEFQQRIAMDEMRPERFRTIRSIAELVADLQGQQSRAA